MRSRRIYAETTVSADSHSYYYEHLVSELRQISQPRQRRTRSESHETLKRELLKIHHRRNTTKRNTKTRRQKRRSRRVENGIKENDSVTSIQDASYSKNYAKLSKDFVATSRYQVDSRRRRDPTCVSCLTKRSKNVIFPCEHLCLCNACLDPAPKQCPLCKCSVHVVLHYTGNVIDEYWKWVDEIKSPLTASFTEKFRLNSNGAINAAVVKKERIDLEHHEGNVPWKRRSSWMRLLLCPRVSTNSGHRSDKGMSHPHPLYPSINVTSR
jgi:rubrerythrin